MKRKRKKKIISFLLTCSMILPMLQINGLLCNVAADSNTGQVTYETTADYTHIIYANGMPLLIVATEYTDYARLFIDANGNGIGDSGEEITGFKGDGTVEGGGIYYSDTYEGYFLSNTTVYGGSKEGNCKYDTNVTLTGVSNPSDRELSTVRMICGGNKNGTLEGSTHVNISGGNIGWVFGGGNQGEVHGSTAVNVSGGCVIGNMYGGGVSGNVKGNTNVNIQGGIVSSVFGGNEDSGIIDGDTNLVFTDEAVVEGWIYGGGAGYNDNIITEVTGSTNITINGGEFLHNIHGGGGWRGAKVGNSNITINGGKFEGDIYGGGEEQSVVTGTAAITINGGEMSWVVATGAGWNDTEAVVGSAEVQFNGGSVYRFIAFGANEGAILTGDLSFSIIGDSFSNTSLWFGFQEDSRSFQNVSVSLKDGKVPYLYFQSPIKKNLNLSFDNADAGYVYMADGILADADEAVLNYENCGSAENQWAEYDIYFRKLSNGGNPFLSFQSINKNRFTSISMKNSYIDFLDESLWNEDRGMQAITERLVVDGGALRIAGIQTSYMPDTTFKNNPILLRTSNSTVCFDQGIVNGTARVGWLERDGASSLEDKSTYPIMWGEFENPDTTFTSSDSNLCLKTDNLWSEKFNGKAWFAGTLKQFCGCSVHGLADYLSAVPDVNGTVVAFPAGSSEKTVTLRDVRWDSTGDSDSCKVVGHKGTYSTFEYSLIPEGTTSKNAVILGDKLTVYDVGSINVSVTQKLNGKTHTYQSQIKVVEVPKENNFTYTIGMCEDLLLEFKADQFSNFYELWDKTNHCWLDDSCFSKKIENDKLYFELPKEYLATLDEGSYSFAAEMYLDNLLRRCEYIFTINIVQPKAVTNPVIEFSRNSFRYDGTAKEPEVVVKDGETVIPSSEYEVHYENNINVGTARVIITDKEGGNYIVSGTAGFEIINDYQPENGVDYTAVLNQHGWTNTDFVITAKEGYQISTGNTLADTWVTAITMKEETAAGVITFYVKNVTTGEISLAVTENYKIDKTNTESYDITFNGISVHKPIGEISFNNVFNKKVDVRITAGDTLSGIDSIAYYRSETILNEEQVKNINQWTEEADFTLNVEDGKKFIIYAKVTDKAGNVVYFGSNGAEFDLTAPVISGVTDGDVCYTTQMVTVTDKNLAEIMLNGKKVDNNITLKGNIEELYVIKAVDRAGNEREITVIMKPVSSLADLIKDITVDNVKTTDLATVENLIHKIETISATENLPFEEKDALEGIKTMAVRLNEKITEAEAAVNAEAIGNVAGISADTVNFGDKTTLEKAKNLLEAALKDYSDNYTDAEKQAVMADILRIQEALESLERVQNLRNVIDALTHGESIAPDNAETKNAIRQAKDIYDSLTDHEKSLISEEEKAKLEHLLAALNEQENPETEEETETISLPETEDKNETIDFPETGDNMNLWLWFTVMLVSAGSLGGLYLFCRKKENDR